MVGELRAEGGDLVSECGICCLKGLQLGAGGGDLRSEGGVLFLESVQLGGEGECVVGKDLEVLLAKLYDFGESFKLGREVHEDEGLDTLVIALCFVQERPGVARFRALFATACRRTCLETGAGRRVGAKEMAARGEEGAGVSEGF